MIIFKPKFAYAVKDGVKTLTRRIKAEGDSIFKDNNGCSTVIDITGRVKWKEGKKEAIVPGRTKKGIGYLIVTTLRFERLWAIDPYDILNEGILLTEYAELAETEPVKAFSLLWDDVNKHKPDKYKWGANPEVWRIGIAPYTDNALQWFSEVK